MLPRCFSGDKSGIGNNFGKADRGTRPSPNAASDGHSGYEPSKSASVLREEVETAQNEVSYARTPVAQKVLRREGGTTETQEQAIAMARGGVRYSGVVFHRKGVKLTQDSPRSMLPRDVRANQYFKLMSRPWLTPLLRTLFSIQYVKLFVCLLFGFFLFY